MTAPAPLWAPTADDMPLVELGSFSDEALEAGTVVVHGCFAGPATDASSAVDETETAPHQTAPHQPEAHQPEAHQPEAHQPEAHQPEAHLPAAIAQAIDPDRFKAAPGDTLTGFDAARPWILAGWGPLGTADIDTGFRVGLAAGVKVREAKAEVVAWRVPPALPDGALAGFLQGLLAALHTPGRFHTERHAAVRRVIVDDPAGRGGLIAETMAVARACHHARNIQNAPANVLTPRTFAARAEQLASQFEHVSATILDEEQLLARGMGAFASVARGSDEPARLIELRYEPPGVAGPLIGWVGKGVTFDSGGTNIKTGTGIGEMKFDMSGAAAVIEAIGAVAELGLPVRIVAVAGATENMPGAHATRPGDIVRAANGVTIEVTNTDAEGRLVLADCLDYVRKQGVDRIVDVATLTGSVVTLFGGRYGALMSNDDAWAGVVERAGRSSGDWVWRIPLDPFYAGRIKGRYADIVNSRTDNDAGTILAGEFLQRFVGDTPWAHVDALAWDLAHQPGLEGGAAYGLRLLVDIARAVAAEG